MGFILPAIASALANKIIGGSGQQQQGQQRPIFEFAKSTRPRVRIPDPSTLQFVQPNTPDSPIAQAINGGGAPAPTPAPTTPTDPNKVGTFGKFQDAFLGSLAQGLVQRILFGGGRPSVTYSPPSF